MPSPQTLLSLLRITNAHPCSTLLFIYIPQTLFSLSVIFGHLTSILLFLCIPQTLISLLTVISAHHSFILLFLYIPQILFSFSAGIFAHLSSILFFLCIPQTSLLLLRDISAHLSSICAFHGFHRLFSHSQQSFLRIQPPFCSFMHSKDLVLILNSHYCTSNLHSALFMHSTDLVLTLKSH